MRSQSPTPPGEDEAPTLRPRPRHPPPCSSSRKQEQRGEEAGEIGELEHGGARSTFALEAPSAGSKPDDEQDQVSAG